MTDASFATPQRVDDAALRRALRYFDAARGENRGTVADVNGWQALGYTSKADLRAALKPYPDTGDWIARLASSGTTADPVVSPWSAVDQQVADATARDVHDRCPSIDGARCAVLAPDPALAVAHSMCREITVAGGAPRLITPADPEAVCRALIDDGIDVVFALPLVASRLGEYFARTRGGTPRRIQLLFCGGDILSPARQVMLASIWNAQVLNMFGCSELFGPLAGPAEHGAPLVWRCGPVAVEVITPCGHPAAPGERGVLVLTTLWPKASPLLRYWSGDVVEVTSAGADGFSFDYVGRPVSTLTTPAGPVALRDVDDALLGSAACGPEWSLCRTPDGIRVTVETGNPTPAVLDELTALLRNLTGSEVEVIAGPPGSLPRAAPKFTVDQRPG